MKSLPDPLGVCTSELTSFPCNIASVLWPFRSILRLSGSPHPVLTTVLCDTEMQAGFHRPDP